MGVITQKSIQNVAVDTTVQEKNIAHPTDSKLMDKARQKLVDLCKKEGVNLRQNYNKVSKLAVLMTGRYAHANQFKRMKKKVKEIKNYLGRVTRDMTRSIGGREDLKTKFQPLLATAERLLKQTKDSKNKLYSLHEQDVQYVQCIAKGKAKKKYEFGCKVSLAVTLNEGFALHAGALEGNPFDGHTLKKTLEKAEKNTNLTIKKVFVDKGYKGHSVDTKEVYISATRKLSMRLKKMLRRRFVIERMIGHMKNDGKLGKNYLKDIIGDKVNAVLSAVAHNILLILKAIVFLYFIFMIFIASKIRRFLPTLPLLNLN
jgi:IS5 family transposase